MRIECVHLKEVFPVLGENGRDPYVTAYLADDLTEIGRDGQRRPCLLICPGGGYLDCSQRESEPVAFHFLPYGFNVFILTYSVFPNRYPVQIREAAGAMELIRRNAADWRCDPARTAIMGFSAGAHLAAHYSTSWDCPEVREVFPDSFPARASVLCYPVITTEEPWSIRRCFHVLAGKEDPLKEEIDRFSCEKLVRADTPPAFLWHTSVDPDVSAVNSLLYAQALTAYHIPFELHVFPFGRHGLATCDLMTNDPDQLGPDEAYDHRWLEEAVKWLMRMLPWEP